MAGMIRGRIWKFGDNLNTDIMSPAQYIAHGVSEVAKHCLEVIRPEFPKEVKVGDVILAGENFGTGSSRETAPAALQYLGIRLVIAKSFARIFFRNSIDIALPLMICPELYDLADDGDIVLADPKMGKITNQTKGKTLDVAPLPTTMMEILEAGGLIHYALQQKW
jgi:3-isopropylmalate/(R)-2-methylmalate dehydratase small subunit